MRVKSGLFSRDHSCRTSASGSLANTQSDTAIGAEENKQPKTPTHFVIIVPGTGPQTDDDVPKGRFWRRATKLHQTSEEIYQHHFSDTGAHIKMANIHYHADVQGWSTAKERMLKATLPSIPWIRSVYNDKIGDIFYYFSTYHGRKVLELVTTKLNAAFDTFMAEYPGFSGEVNLVAHSLGGMICYEILYYMQKRRQGSTAHIGGCEAERYAGLPELKFKPRRLFSLGTPLGGTVVFRNLSLEEYHIGDVGFHNVFHPFDPFGYRTEPLCDNYYADVPAVPIAAMPVDTSSGLLRRRTSDHSNDAKPPAISLGGSMVDLGKNVVGAMRWAAKSSVSVSRKPFFGSTLFSNSHSEEAQTPQRQKQQCEEENYIEGNNSTQRPSRRRSIARILHISTLRTFSLGHRRHSSSVDDHRCSSPVSSNKHRTIQRSKSDESTQHTIVNNSTPAIRLSETPMSTSAASDDDASSMSTGSRVLSVHLAAAISTMDKDSTTQAPDGNDSSDDSNSNGSNSNDSDAEAPQYASPKDPMYLDPSYPTSPAITIPQPTRQRARPLHDLYKGSTADAMLGPLIGLFGPSMPPNREQQMAEAQGLPLSSRLMTTCQAARTATGGGRGTRLFRPLTAAPTSAAVATATMTNLDPFSEQIVTQQDTPKYTADITKRHSLLSADINPNYAALRRTRSMPPILPTSDATNTTSDATDPPLIHLTDKQQQHILKATTNKQSIATNTIHPQQSNTHLLWPQRNDNLAIPQSTRRSTTAPAQTPPPPPPSKSPAPASIRNGAFDRWEDNVHRSAVSSPVEPPRDDDMVDDNSNSDGGLEAHPLPYPERMDYIIPFNKRYLQNEYWLGFNAHSSYWENKDVMHHILYHMLRNNNPKVYI
ncbi:hypothetical protein GGI07_003844 [Coemansia sp. Benny D115]|nr:hypothetical protein GGI07_003844 [Coemansia sp. Benny D115]